MAFSELCAFVHLQGLVPLLSYVHQRLRCAVGIPTLDRISLPQVPQDHLPGLQSMLERVENLSIHCL
jgi:hypothetical protein